MIFVILFIVFYLLAGALVSFSEYCYWNGRWKGTCVAPRPPLDFADKIFNFVFVPLTWPIGVLVIPKAIFHKYPLKF